MKCAELQPEDSSLRSQPADRDPQAMDGVGSMMMEELTASGEAGGPDYGRTKRKQRTVSNDAGVLPEVIWKSIIWTASERGNVGGYSRAFHRLISESFFTTVHGSRMIILWSLRLRKAAELVKHRYGQYDQPGCVGISTARIIFILFSRKVWLYTCPVSETDKEGAGKWKNKN